MESIKTFKDPMEVMRKALMFDKFTVYITQVWEGLWTDHTHHLATPTTRPRPSELSDSAYEGSWQSEDQFIYSY